MNSTVPFGSGSDRRTHKKGRGHGLMASSIFVVLSILLFASSCSPDTPGEALVVDAVLMETVISIRAHGLDQGDQLRQLMRDTIAEIEAVARRLSVYDSASEVNSVNQSAGSWQPVSDELSYLVRVGLDAAEATDGVFDPTVGPLILVWGFYSEEPSQPSSEALEAAIRQVDYREIRLDGNNLWLAPEMALDLEALNKGYATDRALEWMREQGVKGALINFGHSSISVLGESPLDRPWRIGLEHPRQPGSIYGVIELHDGESMSTSGDYQKYFYIGEQRYPHILNANTGWPATTFQAVTVVTRSSAWADAISTAVFAMEADEAMQVIESLSDVEAVMILQNGEMHLSTGMTDRLEVRD